MTTSGGDAWNSTKNNANSGNSDAWGAESSKPIVEDNGWGNASMKQEGQGGWNNEASKDVEETKKPASEWDLPAVSTQPNTNAWGAESKQAEDVTMKPETNGWGNTETSAKPTVESNLG